MMSEDPTFKEKEEETGYSPPDVVATKENDCKLATKSMDSSSDTTSDTATEALDVSAKQKDLLDIRIVPVQDSHLPQICDILQESFHSKRCLLCLPVAESLDELQQRYQEMPDAKRKLGAVAVHSNKRVLGYVQMSAHGFPVYPEDFHTCQRDELYIEIVAVSGDARGQGIGSKLLKWCQTVALEQEHIARLELEVLRGNPAIALYERLGFDMKIVVTNDCWESFCSSLLICCMLGRPYGFFHKEWGSIEMEMILYRREDDDKDDDKDDDAKDNDKDDDKDDDDKDDDDKGDDDDDLPK